MLHWQYYNNILRTYSHILSVLKFSFISWRGNQFPAQSLKLFCFCSSFIHWKEKILPGKILAVFWIYSQTTKSVWSMAMPMRVFHLRIWVFQGITISCFSFFWGGEGGLGGREGEGGYMVRKTESLEFNIMQKSLWNLRKWYQNICVTFAL